MRELHVAGQRLWLLPQKAAFLPDAATLLVADVHLGKAHTFRRLGVPVPGGTTQGTLQALSALLHGLQARRLVVLGDFLHGPAAHDAVIRRALTDWRRQHAATAMLLVRGNHDDRAGDPPPELDIELATEGEPGASLGGLHLRHHPDPGDAAPADAPSGYALAGHLHPGVRLHGRARGSVRLPCFWFGRRVGVLPAFGEFTGLHLIDPSPGDRVFPLGGDRLFELTHGEG